VGISLLGQHQLELGKLGFRLLGLRFVGFVLLGFGLVGQRILGILAPFEITRGGLTSPSRVDSTAIN